MDMFTLLRQQHDEVKSLLLECLAEWKNVADSTKRRKVDILCQTLNKHMELEETVLYPAMADKGGVLGDLSEDAFDEQSEIRELISIIKEDRSWGRELEDRLREMFQLVDHYVMAEETEIFPVVSHEFSLQEIEALSDQMYRMNEKIGISG